MEKEFVRVRSMRDVIISAAMTVIGIVLIILPTSVSVNIFGTCLAVLGVLMLDIYVGHGCNKVFIRVSEFIPYNYEPCSDWFEYDVAQVAQMIAK